MALPASTGLGLRPVPPLRKISAGQGRREQEYGTASRPLGNHRSLRADPQPHVLRPPGVLAWAGPGVALAYYRTPSGQSCPLFFSSREARREAIRPSLRPRVSRLPKTSKALVALDTLSSAPGRSSHSPQQRPVRITCSVEAPPVGEGLEPSPTDNRTRYT